MRKLKNTFFSNIKDYIESPCGINYYQAIHVKYKYENTLGEIQIKTEKMAEVAEKTYNKYKNK